MLAQLKEPVHHTTDYLSFNTSKVNVTANCECVQKNKSLNSGGVNVIYKF